MGDLAEHERPQQAHVSTQGVLVCSWIIGVFRQIGRDHRGDWYRAGFTLPAGLSVEGAGASTLSVNMSGFGSGNLFVNGQHLAYFNLAPGNSSKCSKGGFGCWPDGDYVPGWSGKPTQDCYHIPPEWLTVSGGADDA